MQTPVSALVILVISSPYLGLTGLPPSLQCLWHSAPRWNILSWVINTSLVHLGIWETAFLEVQS